MIVKETTEQFLTVFWIHSIYWGCIIKCYESGLCFKLDWLYRNRYFHFSGNYVLNYLATRPKLPNFVIQALVTLFARISKLGWFDSDKDEFVFRNVVTDITKFLQVSLTWLRRKQLVGINTPTMFLNIKGWRKLSD